MSINKRTKRSRQRGSHTHGWGAKKKHRGAGNRGGRGMAGTGKRADQKKPTIINLYGNEYFGKRGFKLPQKKQKIIKIINLEDLEQKASSLLVKGLAKKTSEFIEIDLTKLGYNKLLGKGLITKKFKISVESASKKAIEKIKKVGGEIIALNLE